MTVRPCRAIGCAGLVHTRAQKGYCDTHADRRIAWVKTQQGKTTTERGYGHAWRVIRARILTRDRGLCQACLSVGRYTQATEVDHIKSKARGGLDDDDNLQALCKSCHKAKTQADSRK